MKSLLALLGCMLVVNSGNAQLPNEVKAWLEECEALQDRELIKRFRGDYYFERVSQDDDPKQPKQIRITTAKAARSGDKLLLSSEQTQGAISDYYQRTVVCNENYFLELKKNKKNTAWIVSTIHMFRLKSGAQSTAKFQELEELKESHRNITGVLTSITCGRKRYRPSQIADAPGFELIKSEMLNANKDQLELTFFCDFPQNDNTITKSRVSVVLDKKSLGLATSIREESGRDTKYASKTEYELQLTTIDDGYRLATRHTEYIKNKPVTRSSVGEVRFTTPDDDIFVLASYGFPEPGGTTPKSNSLLWWIIGAVTLMAVLSVAFRLVARRLR